MDGSTRLVECFKSFDEKKDGTIGRNELFALLRTLDKDGQFQESDLQAVLEELDTNEDGVINYAEFAKWLRREPYMPKSQQSPTRNQPPRGSVPNARVSFASDEDVIVAQHHSEACSSGDSPQEKDAQEQRSKEDGTQDTKSPPASPGQTSLHRKSMQRRWSIITDIPDDDDLNGRDDLELKRLLTYRRVHKGVCWKLIAEYVDTLSVESMKVVMNWRRREFVVKKEDDHVGILYVSEKNNGDLGHACTLKFGKDIQSIIEELPCVAMEAPDAAAELAICSNLHSYDLYTSPIKALKNASLYESSIPDALFPLHITWLDVDTKRTRHTILGMTSGASRAIWLKKLLGFMG